MTDPTRPSTVTEPNGITCYECGFTGYEDPTSRCPNEDIGEDHPAMAVFIEECPNGVKASDWVPGLGYTGCDSDVHVGRTGQHVTELPDYLQ